MQWAALNGKIDDTNISSRVAIRRHNGRNERGREKRTKEWNEENISNQ